MRLEDRDLRVIAMSITLAHQLVTKRSYEFSDLLAIVYALIHNTEFKLDDEGRATLDELRGVYTSALANAVAHIKTYQESITVEDKR